MKIFDFQLMLDIISFSAKFIVRLNLVRVSNPDKVDGNLIIQYGSDKLNHNNRKSFLTLKNFKKPALKTGEHRS